MGTRQGKLIGHHFPSTCAAVRGVVAGLKRCDGLAFLGISEPKATLPPTTAPRPVPTWARVKKTPTSDTDAAFVAGASLPALDAVPRPELIFAGVWPFQRLRQPCA
jgi:hypothetical protein